MGNCYARQQRDNNYIDKNIRVQREIGAGISISKSAKKIGLDSKISGRITSSREETYCNNIVNEHIPSVIELIKSTDQTTQT